MFPSPTLHPSKQTLNPRRRLHGFNHNHPTSGFVKFIAFTSSMAFTADQDHKSCIHE